MCTLRQKQTTQHIVKREVYVATIQWQQEPPSQDFEGCLHNNTGRSSRRGHVHGFGRSVDGRCCGGWSEVMNREQSRQRV